MLLEIGYCYFHKQSHGDKKARQVIRLGFNDQKMKFQRKEKNYILEAIYGQAFCTRTQTPATKLISFVIEW